MSQQGVVDQGLVVATALHLLAEPLDHLGIKADRDPADSLPKNLSANPAPRYKSSLVQTETYLLLCQRYIEMNPVRAAMVANPAEYPWSSYRHHALGEPNGILPPHDLYTALGNSAVARQQAYRELFVIGLDDEPINELRMALNQNQPIGNQRFYDQIEAATGQRRELKKRGRPRRRKDDESLPEGQQGELPLWFNCGGPLFSPSLFRLYPTCFTIEVAMFGLPGFTSMVLVCGITIRSISSIGIAPKSV